MESDPGMVRKKRRWLQTEMKVNSITDRLDLGIDNRIRESIVALQVLGFVTTASCEGHVKRGLAAPWINVGRKVPREILIRKREAKGYLNDSDAEKIISVMKKNLKGQIRLMQLLDEFYEERKVSLDVRLALNQFGIYGNSWLKSSGEIFQQIRPKERKEKKLRRYQREMKDFTEFLKKKYFTTYSKPVRANFFTQKRPRGRF